MKRLAFVVFSAIVVAMFAAVLMAHGSPVPASPTLTATEQIALHSMAVENQQLQQQQTLLAREISAIETDIAKAHPGFRLDPANPLSGQLIPVPATDKK